MVVLGGGDQVVLAIDIDVSGDEIRIDHNGFCTMISFIDTNKSIGQLKHVVS